MCEPYDERTEASEKNGTYLGVNKGKPTSPLDVRRLCYRKLDYIAME